MKVYEFGRLADPDATGLFPPWPDRYFGAHLPGSLPDAASASRKYRFSFGNQEFTAGHLYEKPELAPGTEVNGKWTNRWLLRSPAITARKHGKGRMVYVGTYLAPELAAQLAETICQPAGAAPLLPNLPEGVEVSVRQSEDRVLSFIQNTTDLAVQVMGVVAGTDLMTGQSVAGGMILAPYGCAKVKAA